MAEEIASAEGRQTAEARLAGWTERFAHKLRGAVHNLNLNFEVLEIQLEDQPAPARQLEVLRSELRRLSEMTGDFVQLLEPPIGPARSADLSHLVDEAIRQNFSAEEQQRISVTRGSGGLTVSIPEAALSDALAELVRNALQATENSGASVRIAVEATASEAAVHVTDDGPGISEAHRPHIFEAFYSGIGRRGLGLTLAEARVSAVGGRLEIVPGNDGGTRASIWLPGSKSQR